MSRTRPARWRVGILGIVSALLLSLAGLGPAGAQTTLSVPEARQLGLALVERGQAEVAAQIARALLQRDPRDVTALIMLARAERLTGNAVAARRAAAAANRAAATDEERYAASMELAAANFALGRPLFAQFWLRRAAQVAPSPELRSVAIRSFRQVEARSPWQVALQFSVVPSSNVNNGSRQTTIEIAGLPFVLSGDAQALSGIEATVGVTARYRFLGVGGRPAQLSFGAAVQRVRLSDDARAQAPDAEAGDYAYDVIELGFGQVLSAAGADTFLRLDTVVGRNWYGGDPLSNYVRAGLTTQWRAGAASVASASASIERQVRLDAADRSAWITRVDLGRAWRLASGDRLSVTGGLRRTRSDSIEIDHRAAVFGLGYRFARPVLGRAILETGLSLEAREYDASPYRAGGREDLRARLSATLTFPGLDYYGFAPTLTLEGQRNQSNVSLYDSEDYGIQLGVRSVF